VLFEPRPDRGEHSLALGLVDWVAFAVVNGTFIQHAVFVEDGLEVSLLHWAHDRVRAAVQDQERRADLFRLQG
jgi:hypothetical protein